MILFHNMGTLLAPAGAKKLFESILLVALSAVLSAGVFAEERVSVFSEQREDHGYDFYAESRHVIPVWLNLSFERLTNLVPSTGMPFTGRVEPNTERTYLFSLTPTVEYGRLGYSIRYSVARGDPTEVRHDDDYTYVFPFAHGSKHRLTQGYDGEFTHFGENRYALDFEMPEGTPVHAARGGLVVELKLDSSSGGAHPRYAGLANYVLIEHSDGTFGNYVHLRRGGAVVAVGDFVSAGEHIGYSGNTGQSSGPHLHFDVRVPTVDGRMQSIPTLFLSHDGTSITPRAGEFFYSYHPGERPFEVFFGRDLTNDHYAEYARKVERSNTIEFRTEEHDLTYVVFVANGYDHDIVAEIDFGVRGVRPSITVPTSIVVPARTEVFVSLFRPDPGARIIEIIPRVRTYRR
ncbi:MAG: M23 family metallopeptidase [Spirochaetaceae bacterium]|nr:MAG: M23 family metallopeptidase [Spirochaetaceae bacterium]